MKFVMICWRIKKENESWEVYLPVIRINVVKGAKACHDGLTEHENMR